MTFLPPNITRTPTAQGKLWGQIQLWLSYFGPGLLGVSFVLQLFALIGARSSTEAAQTGQSQVADTHAPWSRLLSLWGKRWGTLFIAGLALLLSVWTAYSDREHKRLSVQPHLSIWWFYDEADPKEQKRGWRLNSQGLGPAVVRVFDVFVDGKPQTTWEGFAAALGLSDLKSMKHLIANLYSDQIVPTSQSLVLFAVYDPAARDIVTRQASRVRMDLCYCSLYNECWLVSSARDPIYLTAQMPVAACNLPEPGTTTWMGNGIRR